MDYENTTETVKWLNQQLDQIMCRTDFLDEMIQEEDDEKILFFLEDKLKKLDKLCIDMGNKINFELKQIYTLKEKENVSR